MNGWNGKKRKREKMQIRAMMEADLPKVCAIEAENFSMPWSYDSFLDSLKDEKNVYIVAEEQGEILGYCGMWGVVGEGQINNVSVSKKHQNKGVATALFQRFLEEGRKKGIKSFTLEVRESNAPAIAIYEKFHFQVAGIRKNFYERPVENAVIMWLNEE